MSGQSETQRLARRAEALFEQQHEILLRSVSRVFVWLMLGQWLFAIAVAVLYSPYAWSGKVRTINIHIPTAIVLGGILSGLPILLALTRPTATATRYIIACAQMLWSALLIHLTGGRIETHFHVFGSLAFLAFYRDYRILIPATIVVVGDHFFRGFFWPESVYGIGNPEWWRFLEHGFWVAFEDIVLALVCVLSVREMRRLAAQQAELEALSEREASKSQQLDKALRELTSHESVARREKLAAVGQLAASVGHELRNPLAAVRNACHYVTKRVSLTPVAQDAKVMQFLTLADHELSQCGRIISDLLDFARERPISLQPCPLRPLVEEAMSMIPETKVTIQNEVPDVLPVPHLDKDQFRQVIINLVQNGADAVAQDRTGQVTVRAMGGADQAIRIVIEDNGIGIPANVVAKVFEPLFTTKTKGTGLGLAIVAGIVKAHRGTIAIESTVGKGTVIAIEIPAPTAVAA